MWLVDVSIRRAVFAVMMIGSLVVLGLVSVGRLGVDLFPPVEFPYVSVVTTLEGASPDAVETEVTDVVEESVNTISGIKQLRSVSADGLSQVFVEFELEEDVDAKAQDVRDKIAIVRRDLPLDVDPPIVEKLDPDASPIMSVIIYGDRTISELTEFADDAAKEALQKIPGVGSITLVGGRKRQIRIWLDASKLRALELTADEVVRAVQAEHAKLPGGRLEIESGTRELGIKTLAEATSATEIADLVVAFRPNGMAVKVKDLARVEDGLEDERTSAQFNGRPGVSLEIRRQSGRNTVEVAHAVAAEVERLKQAAPDGVTVIIARDVSRFIEASIEDVTVELEIAIALVILVTFVFLLSWRATLIVAIAIPTSLIATFFVFGVFGFTLNTLTLLAITVAIGLLVDDAIVVIEAIQRDIDRGIDRMTAASTATHRVGLAVLAGTFSTLAVFVPIAFMEGIVGQFFFQYGLAIVASVSVSLLVALTLTPMLASRALTRHREHGRILAPVERVHRAYERWYGRMIVWAIRWRYIVLLVAVGSVFVGGWFASQIPTGFISKADRSEFLGTIELPLGVGITDSRSASIAVTQALRKLDHVIDVLATIGGGSQQKANQIDLYVTLTPKQQRSIHQFAIMEQARDVIRQTVPTATKVNVAEVPWISGGGISNADIEIVVRGDDIDQIRGYTDLILADMARDTAFADIRSSYEDGRPEIQVAIDRRRAADLGISARSLATTIRTALGGIDAGTFEESGKRFDIRVRLEEEQRQDFSQIALVQFRGANGRLVDLQNVASLTIASGPAQIDRLDRARKISLFANNGDGVSLGAATERLNGIIAAHPLPPGLSLRFEGQARRMAESGTAIAFAFALALVALYIVLASQFNSFGQPFVIMLTAPLSFSGAFAAMYIAGEEMALFGQIGMIALMGIVMKNGILLVDRANQLRGDGLSSRLAMAAAAPERLRPILMTALSAIFGMIPVALSNSDASEWRNSMGVLIIGGLISSTMLTLAVVPAAFVAADDLGALSKRLVRSLRASIPAMRFREKTAAIKPHPAE